MPTCVSWVCNTKAETETGNEIHGFGRQINWSYLLGEYTQKFLTFASDRTEALRGIGQLYEDAGDQHDGQCYRKDGCIPEYGVWKDQLAFQLLWFNDDPYYRHSRLPVMPSWSWAATDGAKIWPSEYTDRTWASARRAEELPERLLITSPGHLQIRGHLRTIQSMPSVVNDELTARDLNLDDLQYIWDDCLKEFEYFNVLRKDKKDG